MNSWTIYSIGDTAFLQKVFQGLAMLCYGGVNNPNGQFLGLSPDYLAAAGIASLIGVLIVFIKSINANGGSLGLREVLVGYVLFSLVFGQKVTVNVESVATGAVVQQSGVPVGFAAVGGVVSLIGMVLTSDMEQAFSTPTMMQNGFQSSLNAIKTVRINTMSLTGYGAANSPTAGSDFYTSWSNYIKECTVPMIELGQQSMSGLINANPFYNALKFDTPVNQTQIFIGGGPVTEPCGQAFNDLLAFSTASFVPALLAQLSAPLGGAAGSAADAETILSNALNGAGFSTVSVSDFVLTSTLAAIFFDSMAASTESTGSSSFATMINDAERNRSSQWMGQGTLFNTYIQPALAFIEGFEYAVLPIVLLIALLGVGGVAVLGKYLGSMMWIQLWFPVLAIVNLYEQMSLSGAMSAMTGSGTGLLSLAGTLQADQTFLAWMGIGGLMTSAVPVLSAAVAYGAWNGVDAVVNRIGGPDNIATDVAAPREIGQQVSGLSYAPIHSWSPAQGMRESGTEQIVPTMQFSTADTSRVESARSEAETATQDFRSRLSQSLGENWSVDQRGGHANSYGKSGTASYGEALATALNSGASLVERVAHDAGIDTGLAASVVAAGTAGFKAGSGATGGGSLDANLRSATTLTESQRAAAERTITEAFSENPSLQSTLTEAMAKDVRDNRERSVFASRNEGEQRGLEQSAGRALSATESYQQAVTAQKSSGTTLSLSAQSAVTAIRRSPQAREMLAAAVSRFGRGREVLAEMDYKGGEPLRRNYGDKDGAYIFAELKALGAFDPSGAGGPDAVLRKGSVNKVLQEAFGHELPLIAGADRNADRVGDIAPPTAALSGEGSVKNEATAGLTAAEGAAEGPAGGVEAVHQGHLNQQRTKAADMALPAVKKMVAANNQQGKQDRTASVTEHLEGTRAEAFRAAGDAWRGIWGGFEGMSGQPDSYKDSVKSRIADYHDRALAGGLTEAQSRYFGFVAGGSPLDVNRGRTLQELGGAVRSEAAEAKLDPADVIERLDAAAVAPDDGGSGLRLGDLAETNRLHGLGPDAPAPGSSLDLAQKRATGR